MFDHANRDRGRNNPDTPSADPLQHLVGHVVVRVDVLHVVAVLERVDQPEHLAGGVLVELDGHAGHEPGPAGADSIPASCRAVRTAIRSVGSLTTSNVSPRSRTSSAPASSTAVSTASSSTASVLGTTTTPLREKR